MGSTSPAAARAKKTDVAEKLQAATWPPISSAALAHKRTLLELHSIDKPYRSNGEAEAEEEKRRRLHAQFCRRLFRKYRNLLGAWRALDPDRRGRFAFSGLCAVTKDLGAICDARALWDALDTDKDGYVGISDLDPQAAELLSGFSHVLTRACGSADEAWRKLFTKENEYSRCPVFSFAAAARKCGYSGDVDAVFAVLNTDNGALGICYEDFILLDKWFFPVSSAGRWHLKGDKLNRDSMSDMTIYISP